MCFFPCSWSSAKEAGGAEVFVDFGPMDAVAATAYFPVGELGRGGVNEAREPDERNDDGAAIDEINGKSVGSELNRLTRSPGLLSKACTPFLQKAGLVVPDDFLHPPQFDGVKP
jgi:hypothetical protein